MLRTAVLVAGLVSSFSIALAQDTKPAPEPKKAEDSGLTGVLNEEEFKALHDLKEGAAPKLVGSMVEVEGAGNAYLSLPKDAKGPLPAVMVIHEWWGLNDHVKHWTDRLAALGYAALAVDLYGGKVAKTRDEAMAAMRAVDVETAKGVVKAAHAFLEKDARIQAPKTASIGWCFGGRWSLLTAIEVPELDACVMYYGTPVTEPEELAKIKAPLVGIFGTLDSGIPPALVEKFGTALDEAKVTHTFHNYEAQHAFANPSNPRYDAKSAGDAFEKVRAFLAERLK
jgi:carboxymethylenebutenolidase